MQIFTKQSQTAVILDDHRFFGEAFRELLTTTGFFSEVHWFTSERPLLEFCRHRDMHTICLFLDFFIEKGNTLHLLKELRRLSSGLRIVMVSGVDNPVLVKKILQHKLDGFISKIDGVDEVAACIQAFTGKHAYISPMIRELLIQSDNAIDNEDFTGREIEILSFLTSGKSTSEIATLLNISIHTVMTHRKNIMAKIGATNISQAIVFAIKAGLIEN